MSYRYSIDSLALNGQRFFGWGWFLDDDSPANSIELVTQYPGHDDEKVQCILSGSRIDVSEAFPLVKHASASGFMMHGELSPIVKNGKTILRVILTDGSIRICEIHGFPYKLASLTSDSIVTSLLNAVKILWRSLLNNGLKATLARLQVQRRLTHNWKAFIAKIMLHKMLYNSKKNEYAVVFSHAMGGGSARYCDDLVDKLSNVNQDRAVFLIQQQLSDLQYKVSLYIHNNKYDLNVGHLNDIFFILENAKTLDIHINSVVSFNNPQQLLAKITALRKVRPHSFLTFHIHDYHSICQSWTLINNIGNYCGIPNPKICQTCLPKNQMNTLNFPPHHVEVPEWRKSWECFLNICDEIIIFSNSSLNLLKLAYPNLDETKVFLRPHYVNSSELRTVKLSMNEELVIGVIGHISHAKGALMLRDMAALAHKKNWPVRIVVFGTLDGFVDARVDVIGTFDRRDLPSLLEKHQISVCFLPSICPETFSYVTSEIMSMNAPIAVFPIGAPAERVKNYPHGKVLTKISAEDALIELLEFAKHTYINSNIKFC